MDKHSPNMALFNMLPDMIKIIFSGTTDLTRFTMLLPED